MIIYPSLAHLGLCIIEVGCFQVDMYLSSMSEEIYNFVLANRVNVNKIIHMIFVTTISCSLKAPMKALIGFGRRYILSTDNNPSCSKPKSVRTILMHQLWANSWKYTCLRMMDCLHHVSDMEGTEGVKWGLGSSVRSGFKVINHLILAKYDISHQF